MSTVGRFALLAASIALAGCLGSDPCAEGVPGTVCRVAGTGVQAFNGDGKPATETAFYLPSQIRRGPDGLLYVMDFNNQRVRRIEADGTVTTVAGEGFHAGATEGIRAIDSALENPIDFDFLPDGRLIFVAYHDPRVFVIDHDGFLLVISGDVFTADRGNEGDGGPAKFARFRQLAGIAVGPDGAVYVADDQAHRVRVIRDGQISTFAGTGTRGYDGDGGPASAAQLNEPTALAFDDAGNLYIADHKNCAIRKVDPDGIISTIAGKGYAGFAGDGGPAIVAELSHPDGIAVAPDGTLFIGDRFNSRVRRIAPDGTIETVAGTGTKGFDGDGGPALAAQFGYISRVQVDTDGGLLIADQTNSSIRKVLPPL